LGYPNTGIILLLALHANMHLHCILFYTWLLILLILAEAEIDSIQDDSNMNWQKNLDHGTAGPKVCPLPSPPRFLYTSDDKFCNFMEDIHIMYFEAHF